jgi:hypothetical protein
VFLVNNVGRDGEAVYFPKEEIYLCAPRHGVLVNSR